MPGNRRRSLAVLTGLHVPRSENNRYQLTRKVVDGLHAYCDRWDGPVAAYFRPGPDTCGNLDLIEVEPSKVGFDIRVLPFDSPQLSQELEGRGVVLGMNYGLDGLSQRCVELGVPCVYNPEYTLRTRLQQVHAERKGLVQKLKSSAWELREEMRLSRQIGIADGVQCNGLPAYKSYAKLNRNPLLYFDSRVEQQHLIDKEQLRARCAERARGQALHLVFSGRLNSFKGAADLIQVASRLRQGGLAFRMSICGSGPLEEEMQQRIIDLGLEDSVHMLGVLDFSKELLPFAKRHADLFVCCHRQGDPSCTYLETLACGVPIVGYRNEALEGLVWDAGVGATVPAGNAAALARLISKLSCDRARLNKWAIAARQFAETHTMSRTFDQRVQHLREVRDRFLEEGRSSKWVPASPPATSILAGLVRDTA